MKVEGRRMSLTHPSSFRLHPLSSRRQSQAMKSYFWKFVLCLLPCALAAWVSIVAIQRYQEGASGGFKLGVDLVGGTILVYEVDLRKNLDADTKFDPNE